MIGKPPYRTLCCGRHVCAECEWNDDGLVAQCGECEDDDCRMRQGAHEARVEAQYAEERGRRDPAYWGLL